MTDVRMTGTELVWPGKYDRHGNINAPPQSCLPLRVLERYGQTCRRKPDSPQNQLPLIDPKTDSSKERVWHNKLARGDNLLVMSSWLQEYRGCIDLVYIDPPFAAGIEFSIKYKSTQSGTFHQVNYWDTKNDAVREKTTAREKAYRDKWDQGISAYLRMMHPRLVLIRELLSSNGHLFMHCDWHIGPYLRVLLDEIFSPRCFKSEIIWQRSKTVGRVAKPKKFDMLSDSILFYSKQPDAKITKQKVKRFYAVEQAKKSFKYDEARGQFYKDSPCGNYSEETIRRLDQEGRIYWTSRGKPRVKTFLASETINHNERIVEEAQVGNIWTDILGMMHVTKHEATRYPTQKPESLLKRIVVAGSQEGSLVADFFCGSGTTMIAAQKLGRRWLGCDSSRQAIHTTRKRLLYQGSKINQHLNNQAFEPFEILTLDRPETKIRPGATLDYSTDMERDTTRPPRRTKQVRAASPPVEVEVISTDDNGTNSGNKIRLRLKNFISSLQDSVSKNNRCETTCWHDWLDYWAVDWNYRNDVFHSQWQAFRTTHDRNLVLESIEHVYHQPGVYNILVKAVDIHGYEASQLVVWKVNSHTA